MKKIQKKAQQGSKNQQSITNFFKTTIDNNCTRKPVDSNSEGVKTQLLCTEKPLKRALSPTTSKEKDLRPKLNSEDSENSQRNVFYHHTSKKLKTDDHKLSISGRKEEVTPTKKLPEKEIDNKQRIPLKLTLTEENNEQKISLTLTPTKQVNGDQKETIKDTDSVKYYSNDYLNGSNCLNSVSQSTKERSPLKTVSFENNCEIIKTPVKSLSYNNDGNKTSSKKSPLPEFIYSPIMCSEINEKVLKELSPSKGSTANVLDFNEFENSNDEWILDDIDLFQDSPNDLDLSKIQRCEILAVKRHPTNVELFVKNSNNNRGTCLVEGIWQNTPLIIGDIVSILATRNTSGVFCVSNVSGLIVLRPDHLISSTSVVAGVFCRRKAILQERWKGIDSGNTAMTIGILIHELVQKSFTKNISNYGQLAIEAEKIIKESIQMLFDAGITEEETRSNIQSYIRPLADFMQTYVTKQSTTVMNDKENWRGHIDKVLDIEENLCCPQLGLKGKIDATLQVTIHNRKEKVLVPLEIKSGKASVSAEHRGQLVLYGMMLSLQRNEDPTTALQRGLLLYLRDRVDMREVSCGYPERRDLVMLRNQLVQYLATGPDYCDPEQITDIEDASILLQQKLPDPVHHENACTKCPYLTLCSLHLWYTDGPSVSESHPLSKLRNQALGHLSTDHIKYFLHWTALLKMEEKLQLTNSPLHLLWTDTVDKRAKRGICAPNLKLKNVSPSYDRFLHRFVREDTYASNDKNDNGPQKGDFSIVSIENRPWIAAGVVVLADDNVLHILLERDLSQRLSKDTLYHADTYESYKTVVQNLTNLGVLMEDTDKAERLRKLIIDKSKPKFELKLPREISRLGAKYMKSLNIEQQRAVLKALSLNDYLLLQGLPGTGKTQTISVLIQMLVKLKQRVLVTAHTHSAVDTVLNRLPEPIRIMRLGSSSRIAPSLLSRSEEKLIANCKTSIELEKLYDSMEVVGVTCLGSGHAMLARTMFDICIVDEATQVLQCTVLRPLFAARKFVLVGDPEQLPPVVRSRGARRLGMEESLFHRLMRKEATCTLRLQYRMNKALADVANHVAYDGRLKCVDEKIALAKLNIDIQQLQMEPSWIVTACSPEPGNAALFIDLEANSIKIDNSINKTCVNTSEAYVVIALVDALTKGGVQASDIGVIAPYRDQVSHLRDLLKQQMVEVSTVDQFQGRDKSVIIYSCTKHSSHDNQKVKDGEVLNDQRRLAVSVTRAKHKLLIVGSSRVLERYAPLKRLIETCTSIHLNHEAVDNLLGKAVL